MAKLSSLKIKMGQMQYEKQRKEHKLQAMKVGFPQDNRPACCMIMGFDLSLLAPVLFLFWRKKKTLISDVQPAVWSTELKFLKLFRHRDDLLEATPLKRSAQ